MEATPRNSFSSAESATVSPDVSPAGSPSNNIYSNNRNNIVETKNENNVNQESINPRSRVASDDNIEYIMKALENGVVPQLSGCTHHFFISKDERFQKDSLLIAHWLIGLGFSVWESQLEKEHGRGVTPDDMQRGVQNAAVVILLLTPGIFHTERHFVWETEIKYALEECHKPLMVIKIPEFSSDKCDSTFATTVEMHHVECCNNTSGGFQPWIRAILRVPTRVKWKLSGVDKKREVMKEFRKIHDRGYVEDPAFRAEIIRQRVLHDEHGACLLCARIIEGETKTTQQTEPLGIIPSSALPKLLSKDVHVEHLNQVVQLLLNDEDGSSNHLGFVGIKAMGGQGKTVMMCRLAHNPTVLSRFSGGVVWINVGRVVDSLLSQIARAFKIEIDKDKTDEQRNITIVEQLKRMKNGSNIVLMLDNIWEDSLEAVKEFLHVCPKDVRVVMTSRDASAVDFLGGKAIDLSELSLKAAVKMLHEQCGKGVTLGEKDAEALASACGRHVLALCHVGAQLRKGIGRGNINPQSILRKIQNKKKVLSQRFKTRGKKKRTENEMDVFACLALSFDMLDENDQKDERKLALGLSMFASEKSIPLGALMRLCEFDDLDDVREVVAELEMRSIVSSLSEDGVVTLHDFMHEVLTERRLNGDDIGNLFDTTVVDAALNYFNAFHHVCDGSHFDSLKTAMKRYGMELGDEEEIVMAAVQANGAALKFCSERLREDEMIIRATMNSFGYDRLRGKSCLPFLLMIESQFGKKVLKIVEDLKENEEKLGLDHSDTLVSVNNLGIMFQDQEKLDEAEPLLRRALDAGERTLGPDHEDTLTSVTNVLIKFKLNATSTKWVIRFTNSFIKNQQVQRKHHTKRYAPVKTKISSQNQTQSKPSRRLSKKMIDLIGVYSKT